MRVQTRSRCALLMAALVSCAGMLLGCAPSASAEPCPDIEVVFARGTTERPGAGRVGNAFTEALRNQVSGKTVSLYPVSYPANQDWPTSVIGVNDAANRIRQRAAECPDTKMVLGGFSQGAAVAQLVTADAPAIPPNSFAFGTTTPLAPEVAERVDAVVLFGKPNDRFLFLIGQPYVPLGATFAAKTLDLCAVNDPICSGGLDPVAHNLYTANGMVTEAATFAAERV
ncbi:cutinase family protein [Mycobacterium sp. MBM]|nr:cutinase family protein [Mycobacterium sp. MBM]